RPRSTPSAGPSPAPPRSTSCAARSPPTWRRRWGPTRRSCCPTAGASWSPPRTPRASSSTHRSARPRPRPGATTRRPAAAPGGSWLDVPLSTVRGPVGVLALRVERLGARLSLDQRQLLEALAGQASLAIERARVDVIEAIIESIEDGLVVLNREGVIVHVNDV